MPLHHFLGALGVRLHKVPVAATSGEVMMAGDKGKFLNRNKCDSRQVVLVDDHRLSLGSSNLA